MATDPSWHDVLAIRTLLDRYAAGIDRKDWDLFASCFTEDVQADYGRNGRFDDRNSFVSAFDEMHRDPVGATLHRITNHDITVTGDTAHAVSYFDAVLQVEHRGYQLLHAIGTYTDDLRRGDDGWRISKRVTETMVFRRERATSLE